MAKTDFHCFGKKPNRGLKIRSEVNKCPALEFRSAAYGRQKLRSLHNSNEFSHVQEKRLKTKFCLIPKVTVYFVH